MIKLHENVYFRYLLVSFTAAYSCMCVQHSNICMLIFDPKVDLICVVLLYCVHCVKEQPVLRIILNYRKLKFRQTKIADLDEARILSHRFHTNSFMI